MSDAPQPVVVLARTPESGPTRAVTVAAASAAEWTPGMTFAVIDGAMMWWTAVRAIHILPVRGTAEFEVLAEGPEIRIGATLHPMAAHYDAEGRSLW